MSEGCLLGVRGMSVRCLEGAWLVSGGLRCPAGGLGGIMSGKVRTGKARTGQVRTGQVRTGQVKSGKVSLSQDRTGQVRTGQGGRVCHQ